MSVTNDHTATAAEIESEHRHKALVESGIRELKSHYGMRALRKHGFMANWAWLLLVCLGHNLSRWTQQFGDLEAGRDGANLRAKRFRYRYLAIPALLVRSARRLTLNSAATIHSKVGSSRRSIGFGCSLSPPHRQPPDPPKQVFERVSLHRPRNQPQATTNHDSGRRCSRIWPDEARPNPTFGRQSAFQALKASLPRDLNN